jgi:hypothetical protein
MDKSLYAFPTEDGKSWYHGMALRDYFAAKAMQALISRFPHDNNEWEEKHIADAAYFMADAMLKERN